MKRPWAQMLCAVLVLCSVVLVSGSAIAQMTVSGTVKQINAAKGLITITREAGGTMTGQAPPNLLTNIKAGDKVSMAMNGPRVMSITKK